MHLRGTKKLITIVANKVAIVTAPCSRHQTARLLLKELCCDGPGRLQHMSCTQASRSIGVDHWHLLSGVLCANMMW